MMKKKLILKVSAILIVIIFVSLIFILINWKNLFNENRPIENLKAIYQIEIKNKEIAQTSDVHNTIQYISPEDKLDPFIDVMNKKGYKLLEMDSSHNKLLFQKDNNIVSVSYETFAKKYIKIESPFVKE
ncbi:hypothetical protein P4T04_04730 [Bacillus badius]|uniref:hypothetical protein n=1 Tax=Bacillus badius TaxID=1455 RepID=UPI002E1E5E24|nr:hypothetical protein [Bacillus badius]